MQLSTNIRNALRDAYYSNLLVEGAVLTIRTGAAAGVSNAATGTVLATVTLPASPVTLTDGQIALSGTWSDLVADNSGTAEHYRLVTGAYVEEGSVGTSGTDMVINSTTVSAGVTLTILEWTTIMPGA